MDRKEEMLAKVVGTIVLIAVMLTGSQSAWAGTNVLGNVPNYGLPEGDGTAGDIADLVAVSDDSTMPSMTLHDGMTGDPGTSNIPEPATLVLLGVGGLALLRRRKRRSRA